MLATDDVLELENWVRCLNVAISNIEALLLSQSPASNSWPGVEHGVSVSVFSEELLTPENFLLERSRLYRTVNCFQGDLCRDQMLFVRVDGLFNHDASLSSNASYFCVVRLYFAGHNLCSPAQTSLASSPQWTQWNCLSEIASIPPESVMMISAYCVKSEKKGLISTLLGHKNATGDGTTVCLGHVHLPITNYGLLKSGTFDLVSRFSIRSSGILVLSCGKQKNFHVFIPGLILWNDSICVAVLFLAFRFNLFFVAEIESLAWRRNSTALSFSRRVSVGLVASVCAHHAVGCSSSHLFRFVFKSVFCGAVSRCISSVTRRFVRSDWRFESADGAVHQTTCCRLAKPRQNCRHCVFPRCVARCRLHSGSRKTARFCFHKTTNFFSL
jgi:hypothetical protein